MQKFSVRVFGIIMLFIFGGCKDIYQSVDNLTSFEVTPSISPTESAETNKLNALEVLNHVSNTSFSLSFDSQNNARLEDSENGISIEYNSQIDLNIASLVKRITYNKNGSETTGILDLEMEFSSYGISSFTGDFTTEDQQVFPIGIDMHERMIYDNELGSRAFGNMVHFYVDLYNQIFMSANELVIIVNNTNAILDYYPDLKSSVDVENIQNDSRIEEISDDFTRNTLSNVINGANISLVGMYLFDDQHSGVVRFDEMDKVGRSLFISSFIHRDDRDFEHIDVERLTAPIMGIVYRYWCEQRRCLLKDDPSYALQFNTNAVREGYHLIVAYDEINRAYEELFGISVDVSSELSLAYTSLINDSENSSYLSYTPEDFPYSRGVYVLNETDEYIDYVPLYYSLATRFLNDGILVNGLKKSSDLVSIDSSDYKIELLALIDTYPQFFPKYRMYYQDLGDTYFVRILRIERIE